MNRRLHAAVLVMVAAIGMIVLLFLAATAHAEQIDPKEYSVTVGSVYQIHISVCGMKASAVAIIDAEKTDHAQANKLFDAYDDCNNLPLMFRVGMVIHEAKRVDGTQARVVEIESVENAALKPYWLTTMRIVASEMKPGDAPSDEVKRPKKRGVES